MQNRNFGNPPFVPVAARGLSLIDACAALAIASIVMGTAAPSFKTSVQRRTVEGIGSEIATDLRFVRSEAVSRNDGVRLTMRAVPGGTCVMIHTGGSADCQCDSGGTASCSPTASLLKNSFYANDRGISVAANVASMRFDEVNGSVTPSGTINITSTDGPALRHVVNILGRVRTCSPNGSVSGVKSC